MKVRECLAVCGLLTIALVMIMSGIDVVKAEHNKKEDCERYYQKALKSNVFAEAEFNATMYLACRERSK